MKEAQKNRKKWKEEVFASKLMIFYKETWILESKKPAEPVHLSLTKNLILYLGRQIKRG
jgi:hypothetical protein